MLTGLGKAYQAAGQLGPAIRIYEEVLSKRTAKLGPEHSDAWTTYALGKGPFRAEPTGQGHPLGS